MNAYGFAYHILIHALTHFQNESRRLTASVEDNELSRRINEKIKLAHQKRPDAYKGKIHTAHNEDRRNGQEFSSDKAYQEICHGVRAYHGYYLRIQHIRLFEVTEFQSAVSLEEQPYHQKINADEDPVASPIVRQDDRITVVFIPEIGEDAD